MRFMSRFWSDEGGASAAEYALLLALIAAGLGLAAQSLGTAITDAMDDTTNCIENTVC